MSNKDLSLKPHHIKDTDNAWWYEETKGIELIVQHKVGDIRNYSISWRTIRGALKRKEKP